MPDILVLFVDFDGLQLGSVLLSVIEYVVSLITHPLHAYVSFNLYFPGSKPVIFAVFAVTSVSESLRLIVLIFVPFELYKENCAVILIRYHLEHQSWFVILLLIVIVQEPAAPVKLSSPCRCW